MARASAITLAVLATGLVCSLPARRAHAAPPGDWSLGVERLFGIRRVTTDTEVGNITSSQTTTSVSLFSTMSGLRGYSSPRLAFDYLAASGLTFGGAFAYESISDNEDFWLLAARLGYFARPTQSLGVWPRAGLTHVVFERGQNTEQTATALTLEVPLVFLVLGRSLGLSIMPHADIGIAGRTDTVDQDITELGLQFGLNAFF